MFRCPTARKGAKSKTRHFFNCLFFLIKRLDTLCLSHAWDHMDKQPLHSLKTQRSTVITRRVTEGTPFIVRLTKFCSEIPSVAKIHCQLS